MTTLNHLQVISDPNIPISEKLDRFPSVVANAENLRPGDIPARDALIMTASQKANIAHEKMRIDTRGRLADTLRIARAARCFNYIFIAETYSAALVEQIDKIVSIPLCYQKLNMLKEEFTAYKELAEKASELDTPPTLWEFWLTNSLNLPTWFECAKEVAILVPSSCQVERC